MLLSTDPTLQLFFFSFFIFGPCVCIWRLKVGFGFLPVSFITVLLIRFSLNLELTVSVRLAVP